MTEKKQLIIRLLTEAIQKCKSVVDNLHSEGYYDPPDEPDVPEECPSCGGDLDYSQDSCPCIGKPCGWVDTNIDTEISECPECGGELEVQTLQTGEDAVICKGKSCGWDAEPDGEPPDRWDF